MMQRLLAALSARSGIMVRTTNEATMSTAPRYPGITRQEKALGS